MRLERFAAKLKKSNLAIVAGAALFLLSSVITIASGAGILTEYYNRTIGEKRVLLNSISLLSGGVDIQYFNNLLSAPTYKNVRDDVSVEYIYVNKLFYVQAVTDNNGKVLFYSVTTRDEDFNPEIRYGGWTEGQDEGLIILGKTKFVELDTLWSEPSVYAYFSGVHNYFYTEGYWTGNPGGYRAYFFSSNESGYENGKFIARTIVATTTDWISPQFTDPELILYRKEAVINTYTVTAPGIMPDDIKKIEPPDYLFGPNSSQVRVLDWY